MIKSSTFNQKENHIINENNNETKNLNDNIINNINAIQKSRTYIENTIPRLSFTLRLNNLGQNHLETVLETVSETSNSKVDSSEISDDEGNIINNEGIETKQLKEESGNINSEQKLQTDTRINDSEYNNTTQNKKSLYFLTSEKTH